MAAVGPRRRENALELNGGDHVVDVPEAELFLFLGHESLDPGAEDKGSHIEREFPVLHRVIDGVGLAGLDAHQALAAAGAVETAERLGACLLTGVHGLDLVETGGPRLRLEFFGLDPRGVDDPLFQLLHLLGGDWIGPLLAGTESRIDGLSREVVADGPGGPFALLDGVDHARGAEHHIAAGKESIATGGHGHRVGRDGLPARGLEAEEFGQLAIGRLAHGGNQRVRFDHEVRTLDRHRAPPAALVGFPEFHADALDADHAALFREDLKRRREKGEVDALGERVLDLARIRGHLLDRAAVHDAHLFRPKAARCPRGVDRRVAATDDHHVLPQARRFAEGVEAEEIHSVDNPADLLARDVEFLARVGPGRDKDRIEIPFDFIGGDALAHPGPGLELHPQRADEVQVTLQHGRRETVVGNSHREHATQHGQGLEDRDSMALEAELVGG